ncbi:MAG: type II secretion system protein GspM [Solidesulfovibrio sp. DCME]|uniref:type II secretion system protein GspM n=1 Tax=Solidesulfovibrio sp. DCME TaxID=3447380 RepID=UPI003D11ABB4
MKSGRPNPWILAAGGLAVVAGASLWVVAPLFDGITAREKRLDTARGVEAEAARLAGAIERAQKGPGAPNRPEGFAIFSYVENAATKEGVKDQVEFMRPANRDLGGGRREMAVDLRLSGLTMPQFLAFLQRVESPEMGVRVRQLILQPATKGGLDVDMSIAVVFDRQR